MLWLIILTRIIANPFSNVFQKRLTCKSADPLFIIFATHALLSIACLPICIREYASLSRSACGDLWVCAFLAVAGNTLIVAALQRSDLSILGPINAYKSIVSLVPSMILLHEFPGWIGLTGMGLIVAGSYFLVDRNPIHPGQNVFAQLVRERGVQLRFAALIVSAIEAVFLKRAVFASSPLVAFAYWSVLGAVLSLAGLFFAMRRSIVNQFASSLAQPALYLALAVTTGLMQYCTLYTLGALQVGSTLALFQMSTILSVLLGYRFFQEKNIARRLIGSAGMGVGAILVLMGRR